MLPASDVDSILTEIISKTTLSDFLFSVLRSTAVHHVDAIHDISQWAHTYVTQRYVAQMAVLVKKDSGLRFGAKHMTEDRIRDIDIISLSQKIASQAPDLWQLLDVMLSGDAVANNQRVKMKENRTRVKKTKDKAPPVDRLGHGRTPPDGDIAMHNIGDTGNDSDTYWDAVRDSEFPDEQLEDDSEDKASERREALKTIWFS